MVTASGNASLETLSSGAGRALSTRGLASGLKLSDEAILHAALTADIGYDSNVFYGTQRKASAVLHVGPRLEISNADRTGVVPSGTYYYLSGGVDFVKYLSDEDYVTKQDAINPSVSGALTFSSNQQLSFGITETFSRYQQAPYQVAPGALADPITRDINMASATLKYAPGGGRLHLMLRYINVVDYYEDQYKLGSNMGNEGVLDIGWRWLPRTSLYIQLAQGVITYLEDEDRPGAYPLRTLAGIRGLLTEKLSVNLGAGYNNAFYSSGPTTSGWGNVGAVAEINYAISILSRVGLGFHHDFVNSPFIGQYYDMDAIYAVYQQMVASRVVTYIYGRYENRRFHAAASRTDNFLMGGVSVDYMIGNFILVGASYSLNLNRTSDDEHLAGGFDYTKQVALFRLGIVY